LTTSVLVHSQNTIERNRADKLAIALIVIYGGSTLFRKIEHIAAEPAGASYEQYSIIVVIVFCFLLCADLYITGFFRNQFCFDPDLEASNRWHALMHLTGSIGHHCIVFL
jgi:hypothetical protein